MTSTVAYEQAESVATITLDDGKVNALSPAMQQNVNAALDRAEKAAGDGEVKAVVIAGNSRVFSAGFDLSVFNSGDAAAALGMLSGGFELSIRLLSFPVPVIMAATGPAIAMGSFLMLTGDHRVGSPSSRFQANEVAIGMVLPTMPVVIITPDAAWLMCMGPPLPLHVPVTRPAISAHNSRTGTPFASMSWMPR
jgi:enoyl-CoA hydratase